MKKSKSIQHSLLLLFFLWACASNAQTDSLANAVEADYRKGLPNFFNKIIKGKKVKVAYLGGSITRADKGWREQTFNWLQQAYPKAQFEQIMAAIGLFEKYKQNKYPSYDLLSKSVEQYPP